MGTLFTHFMGRRSRVTGDTGIYTVFIGSTKRCFLHFKNLFGIILEGNLHLKAGFHHIDLDILGHSR